MSEALELDDLWHLGVIAPWYLYDYQLPVYDFVEEIKEPVFEATRRFGKTTTVLIGRIEKAMRTESWVVRWCEPWKDQARKIVLPEMDRILESCPERIRPKFYRTDSFYEVPRTGSRIYLLGVNEDRGESARGSFAHEIVCDELGSWKDAPYILNEALRPQLLTTGGQMFKMSTPPQDLGHHWYEEKARAIADSRFIMRDFDSIESLTHEEKETFIESMGGRLSTAVKRELYCEPVADSEALVIPEYKPEIHDVDDDYPRPEYFDSYVGIDLGFNDRTAGIFAYWDFSKRELVIEDEWLASGKNSREIVESFQAKEQELGYLPKPYRRVGDNDLQQLYDMGSMFGYWVNPTAKDDKIAAINALRLRFSSVRIKIKRRCESVRYQLKVGLWNDRRTDFLRGERTGHLDAVAALIYLSRNVDEHHNPSPHYGPGVSIYTHHVIPSETGQQTPEEEAFSRLLRPFGG